MSRLMELADKLSPLEKQLLLGECKGWGSWMWDAGKYMVSLGLGTREQGNIQFNTSLAKELTTFLRAQSENPGGGDE